MQAPRSLSFMKTKRTKKDAKAIVEKAIEVGAECRADFKHFLKYVYIQDPLKGRIRLEPWPHLREGADLLQTERLVIILKARQIGWSWLVAAFGLWTAMYHEQANVLMLSIGEREAIALLRKCKFIFNNLPEYLQCEKTLDSTTQLAFAHSNGMLTALPSTEDAGRSEAATLVIADEWDFHEYAEENYAASKPTIDAGGQFVGITTRNVDRQDTFAMSVYHKAKLGHNNFKARFYGCFCRPGRDDQWYEEQAKEYSTYRLRAEYPRTEDEALTPLKELLVFRDAIASLKAGVLKPLGPERLSDSLASIVQRNRAAVYFPPNSGMRYVCGVDVAEGQGGGHDYSVATIVGTKGLQHTVVAVLHRNDLRPDLFAREVYELCSQYFNPLLCYENNGLGVAFGGKMMELRYPNLYYKDESARLKGKAGLNTSLSSYSVKGGMIAELGDMLANDLSVPCQEMVSELCVYQYVETDSGKIRSAAPKGAHDDTVTSLAISCQMLGKADFTEMPRLKLQGSDTYAMR